MDEPSLGERNALLGPLTPAQRAAVEHVYGPLLILAGPGSGKTRVITHRIAYLLHHGIPAHHIVALTFTNKAADAMRGRVERLVPGSSVWLGTFHRFCAQLLRRHAALVGLQPNFTILDSADSRDVLKQAIDDVGFDMTKSLPGKLSNAVSWAKNHLIAPEQYTPAPDNPTGAMVAQVYPRYQQRLQESNAVDFDDLLMYVALLLRENADLRSWLDERYRFIMVDEYQDTNLAQYAIVRALSVDHPNLAVTGDPDQSIYGWRGATIRNILEFERDFPQVCVVRLEQNYRSTQRILRAADQLIRNNVSRKHKELFTDHGDGKQVRLVSFPTAQAEAEAIAVRIANEVAAGLRRPRDFAIFYRTNALSRTLERALRGVGLPYQIVRGLEFYQRKEIKDIVAYLQLLNNPANDVAFQRIINTPPRGIGKQTLRMISAFASEHRLPLLAAVGQARLQHILPKRPRAEVVRFCEMVEQLQSRGGKSVKDVIVEVLARTEYRQFVAGGQTEEDLQRGANVDELITDAMEFDKAHPGDMGGLEAFLEQASLVSDVDGWNTDGDRVTMMTLHAAKGLEFPVVFIVAVDDGILPHERSREFPEQLEEERRLLFVGITRAREELQLSTACSRPRYGTDFVAAPSGFLMELPREDMEVLGRFTDRDGPNEYAEIDTDSGVWGESPPGRAQREYSWEADPAEAATERRRAARGRQRRPTQRARLHLVTGADLADQATTPSAVSPDAFQVGTVVAHPEYGIGKVVTVHGAGVQRTARVCFVGGAGTRSFRVAISPLRPLSN